jgi:hypothetical protein
MDLRSDNQTGMASAAVGAAEITKQGVQQGISAVWNLGGNVAKRIRDNAKQREAQGISDAGNYWTMRPYLKSLINIPDYILQQTANQGISEYAIIQLPAQGIAATNANVIDKLKMITNQPVDPGAAPAVAALRGSIVTMASLSAAGGAGATAAAAQKSLTPNTAAQNIQKYLPYALGALALGLIVYFIAKRK